jgi:hypothetical protein
VQSLGIEGGADLSDIDPGWAFTWTSVPPVNSML